MLHKKNIYDILNSVVKKVNTQQGFNLIKTLPFQAYKVDQNLNLNIIKKEKC